MTGHDLQLQYFFAPSCGWCYASAPALEALATAYPDALRMMPLGLFADEAAMSMGAMAKHAWRNDLRIGTMTGQVFSETYRDQILRKPDGVFDSGPATRAFVALGENDRMIEPTFLHAVQRARYIEGRDTAMAMLPRGGVPQLLVIKGGRRSVIQGSALYGGGAAALEAVAKADGGSA